MARFIHTSRGKHWVLWNPYSSAHSATFGPTPKIFCSSCRPSSTGEAATFSKSTSPETTFLAASSKYLARNPARSGARSSRVQAARRSGAGKAAHPVPGMGSPSWTHSRSMIPLIRGMWMFWEMMKEHKASQGSWRKMRMPGAKSAASFSAGLIWERAARLEP